MKATFIHSLLHCTVMASLAGLMGACDDGEARDVPTTAEASEADIVTPEELGLGDDWVAVEPGLWVLDDENGERKYLGIGEAGKVHAVASLADVEAELESSLAEVDSADTRATLEALRGFLDEVGADRSEDLGEAPTLRCSFKVSGIADAYPIACGVAALASASYEHPCGSAQGTVKTFASASCGYQSKSHQCGPYSADPAACSASTSITGAGPCSSNSYAQITGSGVNLYLWDNNSQRGACGGGGLSTSGLPYPNQCPGYNVECIPN